MDRGEKAGGTEKLALRLDGGSSLFLFGYYLRALEAVSGGASPGDGQMDAKRILVRLHETALRSESLEPFCNEVADVLRLLEERTNVEGRMEEGLASLLEGCARRWFQRVREMPKRRNSLGVDIAFNLELAGLSDIAADMYEALICFEAGAFRASRLMSRRALDRALEKAGAAGEDLGTRLRRAKEAGLLNAADLRSALANHSGAQRTAGENGPEEGDCSSAEWALESAHRLVKKLLRSRIEEALLRAARADIDKAGPVRCRGRFRSVRRAGK
jgi:hypothetical protein